MTPTPKCPKCGAALTETAAGLCPACLMKQAMPTAVTIESTDTQTTSPEIGTKVRYFGDYELLQEIARGGMGVIYQARQASLNRTVALKMILSGQLATEAEVKRFHAEAEAAANLQHPNIVAIHEVGKHDGRHYFTMDFVEGQNLAQVIDGQPLPAQRAAHYAKTIAETIHFAHQRGTLHRDLKPQNVMIDAADHVRITDFGLAKQLHGNNGLTHTGAVMGSPNYMAPEQAQGRQDLVGAHSDVYAVGAILYELLTGRPPFLADTPVATMAKVVEQDPVAPSKLNAAVPRDLETICLKCLEKSPQRRYPTGQALAEDLGRFLKQEPILARPVSAGRKVEQWVKRHPLVLAGAAALALLALAGLSYGLWQQNRYLVWHAAHPEAARVAGPRTAFAKTLNDISTFVFLVMTAAILMIQTKLRGIPLGQAWGDLWRMDQWRLRADLVKVSPWAFLVIEAISVSIIVFALFYLVKWIEAFVWEGYGQRTDWWTIYALLYFGGALLLTARRQRRIQLFGQSAAELAGATQELLDRVVAALRSGDLLQARKFYREATQCTFAEAKTAVQLLERMVATLRSGDFLQARKFYREATHCTSAEAITAVDRIAKRHGLPPAKIALTRLAVLFLIECVALAALWFVFPPHWRRPLLTQFGCGWMGGVAIVFGSRLKESWKVGLVLMPSLMMMIVVPVLYDSYLAAIVVLVGMLAGSGLVSGSYRKER